jgi:hypothetical protein
VPHSRSERCGVENLTPEVRSVAIPTELSLTQNRLSLSLFATLVRRQYVPSTLHGSEDTITRQQPRFQGTYGTSNHCPHKSPQDPILSPNNLADTFKHHLSNVHSNLVLSLHLDLPRNLFPRNLRHTFCTNLSLPPYVSHDSACSLSLSL